MRGRKFDGGKLRWSLLPLEPVREIIRVLMFGAAKYADDNWKKVEKAEERYYDAAMRHLTEAREGERVDPESGLLTLAHAACCIIFLLWFELTRKKTHLFRGGK